MFVEDNETIKVTLYFKKKKTSAGLRVESSLEKVKEVEKVDFKAAAFELRPLTWKVYNELMRESKVQNPMTMADDTDWTTYRERKLLRILAKWDAKDAAGKDIPVTPDNIMRLHPIMAETLLNEYDRVAFLGEEERKN